MYVCVDEGEGERVVRKGERGSEGGVRERGRKRDTKSKRRLQSRTWIRIALLIKKKIDTHYCSLALGTRSRHAKNYD